MSSGALKEQAIGYAVTHGLCMGKKGEGMGFTHCPFMLHPCRVPRHLFEQVVALMPVFNVLVDKVARDYEYLREHLVPTGKADSFTGDLLSVHEKVYGGEGAAKAQKMMLGIHRSDYMFHSDDAAPNENLQAWAALQVEINTISSAFAGLSTKVNGLHRYATLQGTSPADKDCLPVSQSSVKVPEALGAAFIANARQLGFKPDDAKERARVLFVVQPGERNVFDQLILEQHLLENHGVRSIRRTLAEIDAEASLDGTTNLPTVSGFLILVSYFRAGYAPTDYPTPACWAARLMLERSAAVKCPSVPYQLVGTKKMQQVLSKREDLLRFVSEADADALMAVFAPMSGLEDKPEQNATIAEAIATPDDWLLKPMREGGGSLIHGEKMTKLLSGLTASQRDEFILMKVIKAPTVRTTVLRDHQSATDLFVSELGIFGTYCGDGTVEVTNECAGHLVRSKLAVEKDGGVAAGVAALDSPFIVG
ncbi:Glutathione synthetase [Diplonema papillatum]|nr:Glutathione synthetase [Diplonema papillatum]